MPHGGICGSGIRAGGEAPAVAAPEKIELAPNYLHLPMELPASAAGFFYLEAMTKIKCESAFIDEEDAQP
jgi:hypothetical protein